MYKSSGIKYLDDQTYRKAIEQYLFVIKLEEKYSDEIIKIKYKINPLTIKGKYNAIPAEDRKRIQDEVENEISNNSNYLDEQAVIWHRDAIRAEVEAEHDIEER